MNLCVISVITVVYNDCNNIENTILSVLNQSYPNIEYVVIDGGSTDGTVDIIKRYSDRLAFWISEKDAGIYDAMNKGIDHITGQYVSFMNSGDTFYNHETISAVVAALGSNEADVLYGDVVMKYTTYGDVVRRFNTIPSTQISTNLCHQSTFSNVRLMKKYKYDTKFKIAADINFFTTIYRCENASFLYLPIIIANYEAEEGVSAKNLRCMYNEYMIIYGYRRYSIQWLKTFIKLQLKLMYYSLPSSVLQMIHSRRLTKMYKSN